MRITGWDKNMALNSFFSSMKSYGKWDKIGSEKLGPMDLQSIDSVDIINGEYGPAACFHLVGTNRVKLVQLDDACQLAVGTVCDPATAVFNHYSDGQAVSHRVVIEELK